MDDADAALLRQAERCSGVFELGEWASLGLGAGRLAHAGLSKGASAAFAAKGATMANAAAASATRNSLKAMVSGKSVEHVSHLHIRANGRKIRDGRGNHQGGWAD
jgi:hypothetical protein